MSKAHRPQKQPILVTCARGIVSFVAAELRELGFPVVSESPGGVWTAGTLGDAMVMNLWLRTAHRVLALLGTFPATSAADLYAGSRRIPWEELIAADGYFSVTSSLKTSLIRDSRYANVKCKDAIADRFRERAGRRPDSGPDRGRTVIHLHWEHTTCSLYLDTTGEPLSRRDYRKIPLEAPMQESLAAAVVMATRWDRRSPFINPMCGSGTLAIEACLLAINRAPGLLRQNFGFMHIRGFDPARFAALRENARNAERAPAGLRVIATDIAPMAVEAARENAARAGVDRLVEFSISDFAETEVPGSRGVVILNPGYGARMGRGEDLEGTYRRIGDFFKQRCQGHTGYVFTGNPALAKRVGLRTKRRLTFLSGDIECRLLEYDLYPGSKKA